MRNKKISKTTDLLMKASQCLTAKDLNGAKRKLEKAAEMGDMYAQFNLGVMYMRGDGGAPDPAKALEWFQKSADQGCSFAQHALGQLCQNPKIVSRDVISAEAQRDYFTQAADQGHADALYRLAMIDLMGNTFNWPQGASPAVISQLRLAAEKEHPKAQNSLAWVYEHMKDIDPNKQKENEAQALHWRIKAANNGHKGAQFNLGMQYQEGRGVEKDEVRALDLFTKAATNGHKKAREYLQTLVKKTIPSSNTYLEVKKLIDATQSVLGGSYDMWKIFRVLSPEGVPELDGYMCAFRAIKSELAKENNKWKTICFNLVTPICNLLLLGIEQTEPLMIYKSLLESQKPLILSTLSDLQERYQSKKIWGVEAGKFPKAEVNEIFTATKNIKDTCDLNDIICFLVEIIHWIGGLILVLNSQKMIPMTDQSISDGSSGQARGSQRDTRIPGDVLDLQQSSKKDQCQFVLMSPRRSNSRGAEGPVRRKKANTLKSPSFFSSASASNDDIKLPENPSFSEPAIFFDKKENSAADSYLIKTGALGGSSKMREDLSIKPSLSISLPINLGQTK